MRISPNGRTVCRHNVDQRTCSIGRLEIEFVVDRLSMEDLLVKGSGDCKRGSLGFSNEETALLKRGECLRHRGITSR